MSNSDTSATAAEFGKPYKLQHPYETDTGHSITEVTLQPPCYKHLRKLMSMVDEGERMDSLLSELSGLAPSDFDNMRTADVKALGALLRPELNFDLGN